MKKINFLIILSFVIIIADLGLAQEYAPLQLGNVWIYKIVNANPYRSEIIDSAIIIDSIKYFGYGLNYQTQYLKALRLRDDNFYVMKEDSAFPEPLNERIYYKKNAQVGDTWQVNYGSGGIAIYTITDTILAYIFDTLITGKILNENFGLVEWDYTWSEEFGKLAKFDWQGETQHYLIGCVINGIVYGDTNLVTDVNYFAPEFSYKLYQNYPNPFNSSTLINFIIPQGTNVTLEVYNILGERVRTLVNGFITAGDHSIRFEADNLTTGVYFYVLRTNELVQTKKMLLIK